MVNFLKRRTDLGSSIATRIHIDGTISPNATVGAGLAAMTGVVINAGAFVGDGAISNTCGSVDHDSIIGDFSHFPVDAHLAGMVHMGNCAMIGIGTGGVGIETLNGAEIHVGVPVRKIQ